MYVTDSSLLKSAPTDFKQGRQCILEILDTAGTEQFSKLLLYLIYSQDAADNVPSIAAMRYTYPSSHHLNTYLIPPLFPTENST